MSGFATSYVPNMEQRETKESPELKTIKEMMENGLFSAESKSDKMWTLLALMVLSGGFNHPDRGSEYWRGKYEALKELHEHGDK